VNPQDLTIEDVLEMEPRERDRVCAEWMGEVYEDNLPPDAPKRPNHMYTESGDKFFRWPHYTSSWSWQHAGRVLGDLPVEFKTKPKQWIWERAIIESEGTITSDLPIYPPLTKESIVLAACICAVRGIEPEVSDD